MAYVYQLERALLKEQVGRFAHYITGRALDVGSGSHNRYQRFFTTTEYVRMDWQAGEDVDVVGSADDLPFDDAEFDSLVSTQVFEHLRFPEKAVQEAYRVLKKGGIALITVPQWTELHSEPHDYWRYTNFGMKELFERNGFKVVEYEQRGGFYTNIAQMKMRFYIEKYQLYKRPFMGRIASRLFHLYGIYSIWRDSRDNSVANRKHTIGWCFVFKKV